MESVPLSIHEAAAVFDYCKEAAISRKKWIKKGIIAKRIVLDYERSGFIEVFHIDGDTFSQDWRPTLEDINATDWFEMRPAPKGSKVRWKFHGLL